MKRVCIGLLLVLALAAAVVLPTSPGRHVLMATRARLAHQATAVYRQVWVDAAWPAENAIRLMAGQVSLVQPQAPIHGGVGSATVAKPGSSGLIGWADWQRSGTAARWRQLQQHTPHAARVRELILMEFLLVPVLALVLAAKLVLNLTARLGRLRPGSGHGTARLATARELRALRPRRGEAGLALGTVGRRRVTLPEPEVYEHVLVCGPPGSGKSSGLIIPNILAERGTRSLVIVDPKNELAALTRAAVSRHSEVWVVDFLDPDHSHGYNPLALVSDYLSAEAFADCWISNTGRSAKEPFWDNAAKQLIVAAVLHLHAERRGGPPTLTDLADFFTRQDDQVIAAILGASKSEHARHCATGFLASMSKNERLLGSVFSELPPRFSILQDARVRRSISRHQVSFGRLGQRDGRPVVLYLALERTMAPLLKPLSACFFMQLFGELIRIADAAPGGTLPRPVLGYLDEFGNIGAIPDMARWMSTVRSARLGFVLAVQDLAQLGAIYGKEGRQIIVTDCATKIALARTSADDAEWFSRGTGTATVLSYTAGDNRKRGDRLVQSGSRGVSEIGRPLLTPGEVTRLREDTMLVLSGNRQPMVVRQRRWYQARRFRRLVRARTDQRATATAGQGSETERWDLRETRSDPDPAASAGDRAAMPEIPAQPVGADDGAIRLDHAVPSGEATWVTAASVPPPVGQLVPTADEGGAGPFELPTDR